MIEGGMEGDHFDRHSSRVGNGNVSISLLSKSAFFSLILTFSTLIQISFNSQS